MRQVSSKKMETRQMKPKPAQVIGPVECTHEWRESHSPICEHLMDHQSLCVCGKWQHQETCAIRPSKPGRGRGL